MGGSSREGWYEREEIQKITVDWVKMNCILTEREKELLQLVYDRKLVRRDHLEIISQSYRNLGLSRTVLLNRAIKKMYKKMVLDKAHEEQEIGKGNKPSIVAIDKAGSMILDVPHKRRIIHRRSTFKGEYYVTRCLPSNYRHINGVNNTEVETILLCEETANKIVKWEHEKPLVFHHSGEKIHLIPDVFVEMDIDGKQLLFYLEYDTGSENHRYTTNFPIIHDKIIKYKKYRASRLWEEHHALFPLILLVTEDDKRVQYFRQKCKELGLKGFGVYHENYKDALKILIDEVKRLTERS